MIWLELVLSAGLVVAAAIKLAEYGDVIGARTRLGGMFVGTLLLAGATSLPELLASVSSLRQAVPSLLAGNVFGSQMFNMFLLAILDMVGGKVRVLRRAARKHALSASLAMVLTLFPLVALLGRVDAGLGWIGWDSLALMGAYVLGVRLLRGDGGQAEPLSEEEARGLPSLRRAIIGFAVAAAVLVAAMPVLVSSAKALAELTGIAVGFVGTTLVAVITSLPELVSCVAAVKLGAYDMAIGNLFGSNMFNMFALGLVDAFYIKGHLLAEMDPAFALTAALAALLTGMGLIGNLAQVKRRWLVVDTDALLIIVVYLAGLWLLWSRGIGA